MATNIPPHNLGEVINACTPDRQPGLTMEELVAFVPGPDFPTAGFIHGVEGILTRPTPRRVAATSTGARASAEIEVHPPRPSARRSSSPRFRSR